MDRLAGDRYVGARLLVRFEHLEEVHPVELIAREDQYVFNSRLREVFEIFADGIGSALVPVALVIILLHCLLGSEELDEPAAELVEAVSAPDVAVEAGGLE